MNTVVKANYCTKALIEQKWFKTIHIFRLRDGNYFTSKRIPFDPSMVINLCLSLKCITANYLFLSRKIHLRTELFHMAAS